MRCCRTATQLNTHCHTAALQVPPAGLPPVGGEGGVMSLVPGKHVALPLGISDSQHLEIEASAGTCCQRRVCAKCFLHCKVYGKERCVCGTYGAG